MKAATIHGPADLRVVEVPDPRPEQPTDAVVRVTHAGVCGNDLLAYRGQDRVPPGRRIGHEFLGVVDQVGPDVVTLRPGDLVVAPFMWSDGTCAYCTEGLTSACVNGGFWGGTKGSDGGQGEALRVPFADTTLVKLPSDAPADLMPALLTLADVMATGHHAATRAQVRPGVTVAVVGDGAIGVCGVLAAHRLGAERIIILGSHADRTAIATRFGATDIVAERGEAAVAAVGDLTAGHGAHAVLECAGTQESLATAIAITRAGGHVGYVGSPTATDIKLGRLFSGNISLAGGVCPVRAYLPELLGEVLTGRLDPAPVFNITVGLDNLAAGYAAMDTRQALKVLVTI